MLGDAEEKSYRGGGRKEKAKADAFPEGRSYIGRQIP